MRSQLKITEHMRGTENTTHCYLVWELKWWRAFSESVRVQGKDAFQFYFPSFPLPASALLNLVSWNVILGLQVRMSWLVVPETLLPGITLNQTVTQLSGLTLRVPPQTRDLWSMPLISNSFSQRTDTSVICHKCWDLSEGKRLFFPAESFFWSLLRLSWHDIQRTLAYGCTLIFLKGFGF